MWTTTWKIEHHRALMRKSSSIGSLLDTLSYFAVAAGLVAVVVCLIGAGSTYDSLPYLALAGIVAVLTVLNFAVLQTGAIFCKYVYAKSLDEVPDDLAGPSMDYATGGDYPTG